MKIFIILKGFCYNDITKICNNLKTAKERYSPDTKIVEAPDYVFEGWGFDDSKSDEERFIQPIAPEGWLYDNETGTFYKELTNREKRHEFFIHGRCMKENDTYFINYKGEEFTVETASNLGLSYEYRGEKEKSNEIKELVKKTVDEIRAKYPD